MARTVKVEGEMAATTTSDHVARTVVPGHDPRLKNGKKVVRRNWIDTEHLSKDRTTNTKFDDGYVWKADSQCGDPEPSIDEPADSLPGALNGGKVNSYAEAQEGQGAKTVYVEGKRVIRHNDKTHQNKRNSRGIICTKEDLAKYRAVPLPPDEPPPPPPPAVPTTTTKPKTDNDGTATPGGGKDAKPRPTTVGTNPTKDCAISLVVMHAPAERVQSSDPRSPQAGIIWVLDNTPVVVNVQVEKCCNAHPLVTFGSQPPQKGLTTTWSLDNQVPLPLIQLDLLLPGGGFLCAVPVPMQLTVQSCKAQFNRTVMVMGRRRGSIKIGGVGTKWAGGANLLKKIPLIGKFVDSIKFLEGTVEFAFAWKQETWWGGALVLNVTGELTIVKIELKGIVVNFWDFAPGGKLITILNEMAQGLPIGVKLEAGLVIGVSGTLVLESSLELKLMYGTERVFSSGTVSGQAELGVNCGLSLKAGSIFEAYGGIEGTLTLFADWKGEGWPAVVVKTYLQGALKAKVETKIGLGKWFAVKGKAEYPVYESPKMELSQIELFSARAAIPSGGRP